jgi:hypothetical protein
MLLLTIEDADFIFASFLAIGFFLSNPKEKVNLNTYKYQVKELN